jgi:hypothetical protein
MAFSSTVTGPVPNIRNGTRYTYGTFTNTLGSSGGNIDTELAVCMSIYLQYSGTAVVADNPVVNETLPIAGSAVTIVTTADADGYWYAIGI